METTKEMFNKTGKSVGSKTQTYNSLIRCSMRHRPRVLQQP